ncbi:MAG: hypothetical protein KGH87_02405 [Thaumarchaeota archaeon]|nr:hypothetical protein [Nitrososphaerota archaeon]
MKTVLKKERMTVLSRYQSMVFADGYGIYHNVRLYQDCLIISLQHKPLELT